jgi:hypothetical protein
MAKRKKKPTAARDWQEPTPEQMAHGAFDRPTVAYRRIPVIDKLRVAGKITDQQHYGLSRYREVALAVEASPMRDSLDKAMHGRSQGLGIPCSAMRIKTELDRLANAVCPHQQLVHDVALDYTSPAEWAIQHYGGIERSKGDCTWIEPRRKPLAETETFLRYAATELAKIIGA